jgi:hypothetical protein
MTQMQYLRYHYSIHAIYIFDMSPHEEQHSKTPAPTYNPYLDTPSSSNIASATPNVNHSGGSISQHAENDEETRALFE